MAQFKPGQSGNPRGRPKGNRTAAQLRKALGDDVGTLIEKIKAQALEGDPASQKLWLERLCPALKPESGKIKLPGIAKARTLTAKVELVFSELARGSLTASEVSALLGALASQSKIHEIDELTRRIEKLEGVNNEPEKQD